MLVRENESIAGVRRKRSELARSAIGAEGGNSVRLTELGGQ